MELYPLEVFRTVASEKSFSRAAEKLLRTQPAVSLSLQRLEQELGERLIDRTVKDLLLTDAGRVTLDYARRFENLQLEIEDRGIGFDPAHVNDDRFGLQGICERARLLHGRARIESAPGKGTRIVVDLPAARALKQ